MERKRKYHLDFLRILAAFLVMVQHTELFELYRTGGCGLRTSFVLSCVSSFIQIDVPLFFLISGALLLDKEESGRIVYCRRIPRFLLLTFLASSFTYVYRCYSDFHADAFFRGFFGGYMDETHWFLYAYIGFLVCLPFLRRGVKGITHMDAILLICMRFVFCSMLPVADYITNYKGYESLPFSGAFTVPFARADCLFYPIMGYYLEKKLPWDKADWKWLAISLVVIGGSAAGSAVVTCHEGLRTAFSVSYLNLFGYAAAMAMFVLVKYLFIRCSADGKSGQVFGGILKTLSPLMLGVYILEPILRPMVKPLLIGWMGEKTNPIVMVLWYCVSGMAVYSGITWVLKKLPVLKKIL